MERLQRLPNELILKIIRLRLEESFDTVIGDLRDNQSHYLNPTRNPLRAPTPEVELSDACVVDIEVLASLAKFCCYYLADTIVPESIKKLMAFERQFEEEDASPAKKNSAGAALARLLGIAGKKPALVVQQVIYRLKKLQWVLGDLLFLSDL